MTPLEVVGCGLAVLSVCSVVGVFVEPSSCFPCGLLSSCLHRSAATAASGIKCLIPSPIRRACSSLFHYLFESPNPVFQCFYLVLLLGGYALFIATTLPFLPAASPHRLLHLPAVSLALVSFIVACCSSPTIVTASSSPALQAHFPYDGLLYESGRQCPTCDVVKPARSKHCSVCNVCVHRFDHHCIWLNSCIGHGNHRAFLLFLLTHLLFTLYAGLVIVSALHHAVTSSPSYRHFPGSAVFYFHYLSFYHAAPCGLALLTCSLSCLLLFFSSYHLFLTLTNSTTNERQKAADIRNGLNPHLHLRLLSLCKQEAQHKHRLQAVQTQLIALDPQLAAQHSSYSSQLQQETDSTDSVLRQWKDEEDRRHRLSELFTEQDGLIASIRAVRVQLESIQRTEDERQQSGEGRGRTVHNVYNRGVIANITEVLFPQSFAETKKSR